MRHSKNQTRATRLAHKPSYHLSTRSRPGNSEMPHLSSFRSKHFTKRCRFESLNQGLRMEILGNPAFQQVDTFAFSVTNGEIFPPCNSWMNETWQELNTSDLTNDLKAFWGAPTYLPSLASDHKLAGLNHFSFCVVGSKLYHKCPLSHLTEWWRGVSVEIAMNLSDMW